MTDPLGATIPDGEIPFHVRDSDRAGANIVGQHVLAYVAALYRARSVVEREWTP
ncbi:MAG: hypothetical protein IID07_15940 [Gemmatimonadetes bacterium]|nr:hypothetical protein [Gemmatimonadota bacterium]